MCHNSDLVIPFEILQQYIEGSDNLPEVTEEDVEKKRFVVHSVCT